MIRRVLTEVPNAMTQVATFGSDYEFDMGPARDVQSGLLWLVIDAKVPTEVRIEEVPLISG